MHIQYPYRSRVFGVRRRRAVLLGGRLWLIEPEVSNERALFFEDAHA